MFSMLFRCFCCLYPVNEQIQNMQNERELLHAIRSLASLSLRSILSISRTFQHRKIIQLRSKNYCHAFVFLLYKFFRFFFCLFVCVCVLLLIKSLLLASKNHHHICCALKDKWMNEKEYEYNADVRHRRWVHRHPMFGLVLAYCRL